MMRALLLALFLLLSGCGYHFAGQGGLLSGQIQRVRLPYIVNYTTEPYVETLLVSKVTDELGRAGVSEVHSDREADAVLRISIQHYSNTALSYDADDEIAEYRVTMTVAASLVRAQGGEPLWQDVLSWDAAYATLSDKALQDDSEQEATAEVCQRLAEEILFQLQNALQ